jgi:hypothetical protein
MTGTDIRDALHEIAETTPAPALDRVAFQRLVRKERRARLASRAGLAVGVAAAAAVVAATAVLPFVQGDRARELPPVTTLPDGAFRVDLQTPTYFLADGELVALDPQGEVHDLGLSSEEVIGYSSESVYAVGRESEVVRFDVSNSDEGPGGWEFHRVDSGVEGAVQSAQLSADGRWLGWVDTDGRLTVRDLKAGTTDGPTDLPANSYLADIAQGTGNALVSEDGDLALHTATGTVAVPTEADGYGWASTASRDLVAVSDRDSRTRVYDISSGTAKLIGTVDGRAVLSPYGDHLVSVVLGDAEPGGVFLWAPGGKPAPLAVPGSPQSAAWADDDTALVTTFDGEETALYGCEVLRDGACARLPLDGVEDVTLAR